MDDKELVSYYLEHFKMDSILSRVLQKYIKLYRFDKNDVIFPEEEHISHLYLLVEGKVRCAHYQANGTLAVVALLSPFCAIGDVEFLGDRKTYSAVSCIESSTLLGIPSVAIKNHGISDPKLLRFIIEQLINKLNNSTSLRLGHLLPVKSRLALYIISQSPIINHDELIHSSDKRGRICLLPCKEELSSLLGTTVRHLNRVLADLINEDIISSSYPGIKIMKWDRLNNLAND